MNGNGIYHDGLTARAINCTLNLTGSALSIYLEDEKKSLLIWNVESFNSCQFNGNVLHIVYGNYPHQSLECRDELARGIYSQWSGKNVLNHAEGYLFTNKYLPVWILVIGFIGLLVSTYFFMLPWVGEKTAAIIPISTEEELGNSISEMYRHQQTNDDSTDYYINLFVKKLKVNSVYKFQVSVIESKEINAFAVPGGKIFVYSALLNKMDSYEELVALLGHEMTHVIRRHSLRSICRSAASGFFIAALFGDVTGISAGILSQADQFKKLQYSRDLETEADTDGFVLMQQNNIDPKGMLDLLKLLKKESAGMPEMMKYLSTHPETDKRIKNVEFLLNSSRKYQENEELKVIFEKIRRRINKYM